MNNAEILKSLDTIINETIWLKQEFLKNLQENRDKFNEGENKWTKMTKKLIVLNVESLWKKNVGLVKTLKNVILLSVNAVIGEFINKTKGE